MYFWAAPATVSYAFFFVDRDLYRWLLAESAFLANSKWKGLVRKGLPFNSLEAMATFHLTDLMTVLVVSWVPTVRKDLTKDNLLPLVVISGQRKQRTVEVSRMIASGCDRSFDISFWIQFWNEMSSGSWVLGFYPFNVQRQASKIPYDSWLISRVTYGKSYFWLRLLLDKLY